MGCRAGARRQQTGSTSEILLDSRRRVDYSVGVAASAIVLQLPGFDRLGLGSGPRGFASFDRWRSGFDPFPFGLTLTFSVDPSPP
jgi:hypothetical protein